MMRQDEIPQWQAQFDKRYGSYLVRQWSVDDKKLYDKTGIIVLYGDEATAKLAGAAPDAMRLLLNIVLSKNIDEAKIGDIEASITKWQRDARATLSKAGVDIWDFTVPTTSK